MRVITGLKRGARLFPPEGTDIRPTSDMVKEAVFSILYHDVEGVRVLDLFAGSGQLGIEALSRGARECVFVDHSPKAQRLIRKNLEKTGFTQQSRIVTSDSAAYLKSRPQAFDVILLDPPYQAGLLEEMLPLAAGAASPTGVLVCETDSKMRLPDAAGAFRLFREYRYGKTKITVYRPGEKEETPS